MKKLSITEIVPAEDILQEEMEEALKGGWNLGYCKSGCQSGGTSVPSTNGVGGGVKQN